MNTSKFLKLQKIKWEAWMNGINLNFEFHNDNWFAFQIHSGCARLVDNNTSSQQSVIIASTKIWINDLSLDAFAYKVKGGERWATRLAWCLTFPHILRMKQFDWYIWIWFLEHFINSDGQPFELLRVVKGETSSYKHRTNHFLVLTCLTTSINAADIFFQVFNNIPYFSIDWFLNHRSWNYPSFTNTCMIF